MKEDEEPIPLNRISLAQAAALFTRVIQQNEEVLCRRFIGEQAETSTPIIFTATSPISSRSALFVVDVDVNV